MTTSEQINEIAAALAKAQASMKNAALNKVNPHFKSKFADLASVRDAVTPALTANGIVAVQTIDVLAAVDIPAQTFIITRLIHSSGQWLESRCPLPPSPDMQKMGSAITYARRYSLSAICGIAADEDDDANAAVQEPKAKAESAKVPEGFDNWLMDLETLAGDGTAVLQEAWKKSQPFLRKHLTDTDPKKWDAIKARAARLADGEIE